MKLIKSALLPARLEATATLIESRLHRHNSELPILNFTMRGHHPDKVDWMAGHRNVRVKTFRHNHRIAISHDADELRLIRIGVNKLHAERRRRHVVINVKLLEDRCVFMRRPTGPVSRFGSGETGKYASGFNIFSQRDVDGSRSRWTTGFKFERRIFFDVRVP